jgi:hypothetical protein
VKYWEVIADRLHEKAGRGVIAVRSHHTAGVGLFDAHRGDGRGYIVQSDELLSAFLELERVTIGQYEPAD